MNAQKVYNKQHLEDAIDSMIEDSMDFLADDISSILISMELDSKKKGIALDEIMRSNSLLSSKLDSILHESYISLSKEIKSAFGIKITKSNLK